MSQKRSPHHPVNSGAMEDDDVSTWMPGVEAVINAFMPLKPSRVLEMAKYLANYLTESDMRKLAHIILEGVVTGDPNLVVENLMLQKDDGASTGSSMDYLVTLLQEWRRLLTLRARVTVLITALSKVRPSIAESFADEFCPNATPGGINLGSQLTAEEYQAHMRNTHPETDFDKPHPKALSLAVRCCAERLATVDSRWHKPLESLATVLKGHGLDINHVPQPQVACRALARVLLHYKPYIERLCFRSCYIDDPGLEEMIDTLRTYKELREMDWRDNDLTTTSADAIAAVIGNCSSTLEQFHFFSTKSTAKKEVREHQSVDGSVLVRHGLVRCSQLTQLTIMECEIGVSSAADVSTALASCCNSLQQLDISHNPLGDECMAMLAQGLVRCTKLEKLALAHCQLTSASSAVLHEVIVRCPDLTDVDPSWNSELGDVGVVQLASSLRSLVGLQRLDLSCCGLTSACSAALRDCLLSQHHSLRHLVLSWNRIDDDGLLCIRDSLRLSTRMTEFNICNNNLTASSLPAVTELLQRWPDLQKLELGIQMWPKPDSTVDAATQQQFVSAVARCRHLEQLWIPTNWVCLGGAKPQALRRSGLEVHYTEP